MLTYTYLYGPVRYLTLCPLGGKRHGTEGNAKSIVLSIQGQKRIPVLRLHRDKLLTSAYGQPATALQERRRRYANNKSSLFFQTVLGAS